MREFTDRAIARLCDAFAEGQIELANHGGDVSIPEVLDHFAQLTTAVEKLHVACVTAVVVNALKNPPNDRPDGLKAAEDFVLDFIESCKQDFESGIASLLPNVCRSVGVSMPNRESEVNARTREQIMREIAEAEGKGGA